MIKRVESVRMEGKEMTEMRIGRYKVFRMICEECETREEERTRWKYREQLVEGV